MTETPRDSVSVAAAILDDSGGEVLLIKRRENGKREPPDGVPELGEAIQLALRREVRREAGAKIQILDLTGVYKNMTASNLALVSGGRSDDRTPRSSPEAESIRWRSVDDLKAFVDEAVAFRLGAAADYSNTTTARHQDGKPLLHNDDAPQRGAAIREEGNQPAQPLMGVEPCT